MILKGKKVILRPVTVSDTNRLHRWINDKKINRFLGTEIPISLNKERKIVRKMSQPSKSYKHFIIETIATGESIGMMSIHHIDYHNRQAITGAYLVPSYWGRGYGSDAKMALLKYAFLRLKLNRIVSYVFPHNTRSVAYSLKCGYKKEGYLRENVIKKGKKYDSILLAVLKKDWLKLAKRLKYI